MERGNRPALDVGNAQELSSAVLGVLYPRYGADFGFDLFARGLVYVEDLYMGRVPGFLRADMSYHDLKHAFDTTLVMTRLIDGYEKRHSGTPEALGRDLALVGVLGALFHDTGFIRHVGEESMPGPALTAIHVGRSVTFFTRWLYETRFRRHAHAAGWAIHYTGREVSASSIEHEINDEKMCLLGRMIGTADLVSQMADRHYLERCRDHLFPELVHAGIDDYEDAHDLLRKTPEFIERMRETRLIGDFRNACRYLSDHFSLTPDPYAVAIERHANYIREVARHGSYELLRRDPSARAIDSLQKKENGAKSESDPEVSR